MRSTMLAALAATLLATTANAATVAVSADRLIDPATGKKVFTFVQGLANRRADETAKCAGGLA